MTPDEIMSHAERLRAEKVGMTNYTRIINDAFVLIRELASNQKVQAARAAEKDTNLDA